MIIEINWLAVVVAAIAGYILGAIWYMPRIFGNAWMDALGKTPDELGSPIKALSMTAVTTFFSTLVLAWILAALGINTVVGAVIISIMLVLGFYGMTLYSDSLFCDWGLKLVAIQISYRVTMFLVIAVTLVLF